MKEFREGVIGAISLDRSGNLKGMNDMDIAKLKVADLKGLLAQGRDIEALLSAMKGDGRVSVRKLADAI